MANKQMLVINERLSIPRDELELTFVRSSGPGGQNVNKINSKVTLRWCVAGTPSLPADIRQRFQARFARRITTRGDLLLSSQRFRDQGRNVADCLDKLRAMVLQVVTPPKPRRASRPTKAARERRLRTKHHRSASKELRREPRREA